MLSARRRSPPFCRSDEVIRLSARQDSIWIPAYECSRVKQAASAKPDRGLAGAQWHDVACSFQTSRARQTACSFTHRTRRGCWTQAGHRLIAVR